MIPPPLAPLLLLIIAAAGNAQYACQLANLTLGDPFAPLPVFDPATLMYNVPVPDGVASITLAEAGARAGYSRGLPSHYFKTKADLLSALGAYIIDSFINDRRAASPELTGYDGPSL